VVGGIRRPPLGARHRPSRQGARRRGRAARGRARAGGRLSGRRAGVRVAAVDLGASSGRVHLGRIGDGSVELTEVARFWNGGVPLGGTLYWDLLHIWRNVLEGLSAAGRAGGGLDSVGIDSWAVDYGLLDRAGRLIGNPVHHRDPRTGPAREAVHAVVPPAELYRRSGIAPLPINTIYQLVADRDAGLLERASRMLLLPDLLGFFLTGTCAMELTNASTTGLLPVGAERLDDALLSALDLPPELFAPLRSPGSLIGELATPVRDETGLRRPLPLLAVASHDTASAVVAVPAAGERFAYVSSGTWSLVGVEVERPVPSEAALAAGFTNERGLDGTTRLLRNVMGLWLLSESRRAAERRQRLDDLLAAAAAAPALRSLIDPDDDRFLAPGDMPARIAAACRERGEPEPRSPGENARCILDSLALAYRRSVRRAGQLAGFQPEQIHVVGGGSHNRLLCQLTADACALPVVAGPDEAAAMGNALVQARTLGVIEGGLPDLRRIVARSVTTTRYLPDPRSSAAFDAAERRLVP
jgi:rhamnulokinase